MEFFNELKGVTETVEKKTGVRGLLEKAGYGVRGGMLVKLSTGAALSYEEDMSVRSMRMGFDKEVSDFIKYEDKLDNHMVVDVIMSLPLESYNGQLYDCESGKLVEKSEYIKGMRKLYPRFDIDKLEKVFKGLHEYRKVSAMPPFKMPEGKGVDNGFRFPVEAYKILKYLIWGNGKYIFTIMSAGDMGKSTFTNFLKCLYKSEYYSADTKYMNQFSTSYYASKRLVVFNDCSADYLDNAHILKQISGGDDVQIEAKGLQAYSAKITAKMLFIGNEGITYNILDSGMRNRFINSTWTVPAGIVRDSKWVNYQWSEEEIAFVLTMAWECEEFDYESELFRTNKEVIATREVFYSDSYDDHCNTARRPYSRDNWYRFFEVAAKYYSAGEYEAMKAKRIAESRKAVDFFKLNDEVRYIQSKF